METADVVVIGAGIIGASVSFHLLLRSRGLRLVLLEQAAVASGATGRSTAIVRAHYVDPTEARLAARSLEWFADWQGAVGGDCGYRRVGFLMVVPPGHAELMRRTVAMVASLGVRTRLLAPADIPGIDARLSPDGVGAAAYEPHGGYAEPAGATAALVQAVRERGEVRQRTPVKALHVHGGRVVGVETPHGEIACGAVVLAAGAQAGPLLRAAGIDLPVEPRLVRAAAMERGEASPPHPAVIDRVTGVNFRPEGRLTIFSVDPSTPEGTRTTDEEVYQAAARVAARFPEASDARIRSPWAELDGYTPDRHPIAGMAPGPDGLFLAVGGSGTSFKTAPALGEALAGQVLGDRRPTDVPIEPLDARRFETGALLPANYGK